MPRLAPLSRSGNGPRGTSSRLGRPDGVCPQFPADHGAAPGDSARLRPARRGDQRAESSTIDPQLRNMVSQMASRAAGCDYCMAHTAHAAERVGIAAEKENALWEFETSLLFSVATDRTGDEPDQSGATRMGELLRGWALQRVLQLHQRLGGEEGQAPSGACSETEGLRLGTVE